MRADDRLLELYCEGASLVVRGSDSALSMQGAQAPSLVGELGILHAT